MPFNLINERVWCYFEQISGGSNRHVSANILENFFILQLVHVDCKKGESALKFHLRFAVEIFSDKFILDKINFQINFRHEYFGVHNNRSDAKISTPHMIFTHFCIAVIVVVFVAFVKRI